MMTVRNGVLGEMDMASRILEPRAMSLALSSKSLILALDCQSLALDYKSLEVVLDVGLEYR